MQKEQMSEIARRREAAAKSATNNPAYRERVAAIREAAGKVFQRHGFSRTKFSDIAAEAGLDRATLYYYVGSKEQLFRDVVGEAVAANIAAARAVEAEDLPPRIKLSRMIEALMSSFSEYYPYMYVFVQEDMTKLAPEGDADSEWAQMVKAWSNEYFSLVRATVRDGIADGSFRTSLPPGVVANCIIGMLNHSHLWFRPDGLMDAEEIGHGISELLLGGLSARD